jgi:phosphoglycerate kinase
MKKAEARHDFLTLDDIDVAHKRVLVRMDLNVPMENGRVTDNTRVVRLLPTIKELIKKKAKVIILSHLGRPEGTYVPDLSLAPLVDCLSEVLKDVTIRFGVDSVGPEAKAAVAALKDGEILLLENLRFHPEEEKNEAAFARALAAHGEIYINDAFSCAHRSHASTVGVSKYLPFAAGRLMEEELNALHSLFDVPAHPFTAIVGGSKVSTKLELLENLITKVDNLVIGGAMANTFLLALGHDIGESLAEPKLKATANRILEAAKKNNCTIFIPTDVIVQKPDGTTASVVVDAIEAADKAIDIGNDSFIAVVNCLRQSKTVIWNGPMGIFETLPVATTTIMIGREIASLTKKGQIKSIAGGGDTVAALSLSRLTENFTYVSTAGGAFLEWMEGKALPGVAALKKAV